MGKCTTETCCLTLPLKLEKWQKDRLAKRFEIARKIYNRLLRTELDKLEALKKTQEYKGIQNEIVAILSDNSDSKTRLKELNKQYNRLLADAGFSKYGFKSDMRYCYKMSDNKSSKENTAEKSIASSVAVHDISVRVWTAFNKMLFGNGK